MQLGIPLIQIEMMRSAIATGNYQTFIREFGREQCEKVYRYVKNRKNSIYNKCLKSQNVGDTNES